MSGAARFAGAIGNPAFSLADAQDYMCELVDILAMQKRDSVVVLVSKGETASWPIKRAEALAFDGSDASAPDVADEAADRGIPTATLAAKVLNKSQMLLRLEAAVAGAAGRHCDAIRALTDFDAIADYDFSTGWPV